VAFAARFVLRALRFGAVFGICAVGTGTCLAEDFSTGSVPGDPVGEWLVAKKVASIRIADCGDGKLWGVVASEVRPGIDGKNPDPNMRSRPTLGMPILLGMERKNQNEWDGQIYNSEDGHTYSANISLVEANVLRVQGCFLGFLCGGENWTRVEPQSLPYAAVPMHPAPPPVNPTQKHKGKVADNQPSPTDEVCLSVFGPTWLAHQRGLK
jgi:uncharacterized protein (DUF2147 family)